MESIKMKYDDALVKYLEEMGVEYVFGIPGDIQTEFSLSLRDSPIKFITTRNEKSAAFMADIYSRVSRKIGICFSTVGPGATNLISGLTNATGDRSSVIAISDQLDEEFLDAHQYVNQSMLFNPKTGVTKDNYQFSIENLRSVLECAYETAMSEPKGAVHISMPVSVHKEKVSFVPNVVEFKTKKLPEMKGIEELNQYLGGRKNLAIIGGVVNRLGLNKELFDWLDATNTIVLETFRGKGSIKDSHSKYIGTISRYLVDDLTPIFSDFDNLILIGYDYNEGVKPNLWKEFNGNLININSFDNTIEDVFKPEMSYFGNLKDFFMNVKAKGINNVDISKLRKQIKNKIYAGLDMEVYPPRPHKIIEAINSHFPDAVKVCDVGKNKYYSGLLLKSNNPNSVIFSNMQSAMGFSSGAIGATFATEKPVVVITGDGGFMMEPQELATIIRYNRDLTIVILNDEGLGLVRAKQLKDAGKTYEVDFPNPDFVKFADAFGGQGYDIKSWGELDKVMEKVSKSKGLNLISVPVDYSQGI